MTAATVAAALQKLGIPSLSREDWSEDADGMVQLTEAVHVQVGYDEAGPYLIVMEQLTEETFRSYPARKTVKALLPDLKKAGVV